MIHRLKAYIKFLWNSKNEHGVHSPFVFSLVTKCFYDKKKYPEYNKIVSYHSALANDHREITVTDFGAGSKVFNSDKRKISQIAEIAGITKKNAKLLFRITNYFLPKKILEIGTSLGKSTFSMALGNPEAEITTLEGCFTTSSIAQEYHNKFNTENINFETVEFSDFLSAGVTGQSFDLIFFDGNHSEKATLQYFKLLLPTVTNDSVWIFDDIHWSPEMEEAWEQIKKHPMVSVTVDTFQWGVVFFRKEQEKEHFVIRA